MCLNGGQSPYHFYVDYVQLWPGGTNAAGVATNGYYLGSTTSTNGTLVGGSVSNAFGIANPFGVQATINDSSTNGIDGGQVGNGELGCASNATTEVLESTLATNLTTGMEIAIPLSALGSPTGQIKICAILASSDGTYLSNQLLGPLGTNSPYCQCNLGNL